MDSIKEAMQTIEQIKQLFRDLTVGGLLTAEADKINTLRTLGEEFSRIGANHISEKLNDLLRGIENNSKQSAPLLMRAQASIQLFERLLTLEYAAQVLSNVKDQ